MIPLTLSPADQDKSIIAPIASTAAKATPSSPGAGATGGDIPIDDSSAEAVVQTYIALWNAKQMQLIPEILVPQQAEILRPFMEAMQPMTQAMEELLQAVQQAFPDNATQLGTQTPIMGKLMEETAKIRLADSGVTVQDNNNALAMLMLESTSGMQSPGKQFNIRLMDGRWRIEVPQGDVPDPAQIQQMIPACQNMTQNIRDLIARIQNNEFASAEMVGQELMQMAMQTAGAMGGGTPPPSPPPGTTGAPQAATPPPAQPAQPPPPAPARQREDVDNVISGPMLPRGR